MPTVHPGSLILVTGASGFIASHTVQQLLERGFSVRGTVRTADKGEYLRKLFVSAGDRFQYVVVQSLDGEGAFNEAVKGVDGILHIASPLYRNAPKGAWENIVEPARRGTTSIMKAAHLYNPDVKRIVITSSYAAIVDDTKPKGAIFSEKDWNTVATKKATELGENLDPVTAYYASKPWAEQAAWDFVEQEKPKYDITTLLPPLVSGPMIHPVSGPGSLPTGNISIWGYLTGADATNAKSLPPLPSVDVRDVAKAHIDSLTVPEAGNKRIGVVGGNQVDQEFLDIASTIPEVATAFPNANWGNKGARDPSPRNDQDPSLSVQILGLKYTAFEDTVSDTVKSLILKSEEGGWPRS